MISSQEQIINAGRVAMLRGKKMTQKQIVQYETAIRQTVNDSRVEAMMLYMAEALHDVAGYGMKRTARILRSVDERMHEWLDPDFSIDDLRIRVFGKTNFMFACTPEEQEQIAKVLRDAGYDVRMEENGNDRKAD